MKSKIKKKYFANLILSERINYKILIKTIFLYLLFYFFIFISLTILKSYSLYNQSKLITSNIRNNILIGDRRSVEQEIINSLRYDYTNIVIHTSDNSIYINDKQDKTNPLLELHFTQYIDSNDLGTNNDFYIVFYFSIWEIVLKSLEIVIYLSVFLVPMYFYEKRKFTNELTEKLKREKLEFINNLALKVSHDIRSPIAALNSILQNSKTDEETKTIITHALSRINNVSNDLLRSERVVILNSQVELIQILSNQIALKKIEYNLQSQLSFSNENLVTGFTINANPIEIESIISNLLNNAIEATKELINQTIVVSILNEEKKLKIIIEDNGVGFNENQLEKLGITRITTKHINEASGSGLAILNASTYLKSIGSEIKFENKYPNGAKITISFDQFTSSKKSIHILLDDDELTRINWEYKARKKNLDLITFKNADDFKNSLENMDKDAVIYIDSELGSTKGEDLALELHQLGFTNLNITSGHSSDKFSHLPFLKSVIDKNPPF